MDGWLILAVFALQRLLTFGHLPLSFAYLEHAGLRRDSHVIAVLPRHSELVDVGRSAVGGRRVLSRDGAGAMAPL
jgi:hypothetical protein